MKNIAKDNKGITLIALITTVVIMIILLSVATYTGLDTYHASKLNKFVAEMQLLQTKVDDLVNTKTIDELRVLGEDISIIYNATTVIESAANNGEISTTDVTTNTFRYFSEEKLLNEFDIENITGGVIINFTTREVISVTGIENEGEMYYTQYKLSGGQAIINSNNTNDLTFTVDLSIDGINATATIKDIKVTNGTLNYKEEKDNYWQSVTNYTEAGKEYEVSISKSGNYEFKLKDDKDIEEIVELVITLINKPNTETEIEEYNYALDSDNWAFAQKDGTNYVWIPRFVFDTNNNIKFVKGNSNIATDNSYIATWNIDEEFTSASETERIGIWVSVNSEEVNKSGLNMMTLLEDVDNGIRTILIEI